MSTKKNISILLFLIYFITGCDQVDVINPEITFKENVVVRSELIANRKFGGISFTKTLPLEESYDISEAELKDVEVYIKVDNIQVIPLHYQSNGIYNSLYEFSIKPGSTYELFAKYNDENIYSITKVPVIPVVQNVMFSDGNYLQGDVTTEPDIVFGAAWVYSTGTVGNYTQASDFYSIVENVANSSSVSVRTQIVPQEFRNPAVRSFLYLQPYAFDKAYLSYFKTKANGKPVEDSFIHGGDGISWNVQGKNAIGLFIGYSIGELKQ